MQSRYYDSETRRFVNADNVGVVSEDYLTTIGGQNLYSYSLNNPVNRYDPTGHSVIGTVIGLLIAIVSLGFAIYGLVEAAKAFWKEPSWLNLLFLTLAVVDVVMSVIAVFQAFRALQTALKAGGGQRVLSTSGRDEVSGLKKADSRGRGKGIPGDCFKAGTQVRTKEGYKNIEDIEVGDEVLAYDEKTGEQEYKKVVRLFRGKTKEWYHVFIDGEEIECTGNHRFYVEGKGYVKAKELTKEDRLRHSDGSEGRIERIEIEQLKKAETKYNFEVEDFHTYYVTDKDVLVHNECKPISPKKLTRSEIKKFDAEGYKKLYVGKNGARFDIYKDTANADKIWLGGSPTKTGKERTIDIVYKVDIASVLRHKLKK